MNLSDQSLTSENTTHQKSDWFQQIHGTAESENNAKPAVRTGNKKSAFMLWHELTLVVFAMVLICYCYYSTN